MTALEMIQQYKNHTCIGKNGSKYIRIGHNLCDVFHNTGWVTPTRYRLIKGTWVHQHGPQTSPPTFR